MTPSCFANDMLRKNTMSPSQCQRSSLCPPITTFRRRLHAETRLSDLIQGPRHAQKVPKPTLLLDLQTLPLSASHNKRSEALGANTIQTFNKIQTQVFQALYTSNENVFIGALSGSGETICAEFALLQLWSNWELCASSPTRKWLICASRSGHRNSETSRRKGDR
jgi:hypothetical protein